MDKIDLGGKKEYIVERAVYENSSGNTKVLLVKDCLLERRVILKRIGFQDQQQKEVILREIKNQVVLESYTDFTPKIYNTFIDDRTHCIYIEMQHIQGRSLREIINERQSREKDQQWFAEAYDLLYSVCQSMAEVHKLKGFIHRDLKPENIIKKRKDAYIIDFELSGPGMRNREAGTKRYMAPEQRADNRKYQAFQSTDVFALGQIAVELFTGEPLAYGKDLCISLRGNTWKAAKDISDLGDKYYPELGNIITKALAMDPRDRYKNAGALVAALKASKRRVNGKQKKIR